MSDSWLRSFLRLTLSRFVRRSLQIFSHPLQYVRHNINIFRRYVFKRTLENALPDGLHRTEHLSSFRRHGDLYNSAIALKRCANNKTVTLHAIEHLCDCRHFLDASSGEFRNRTRTFVGKDHQYSPLHGAETVRFQRLGHFVVVNASRPVEVVKNVVIKKKAAVAWAGFLMFLHLAWSDSVTPPRRHRLSVSGLRPARGRLRRRAPRRATKPM